MQSNAFESELKRPFDEVCSRTRGGGEAGPSGRSNGEGMDEQAALPRVMVGMPVYNAAPWLAESLQSWRTQSLTNFRLVICDNASTDESFEICAEFAKLDPRISLHRNPRNIGICGNFRRVFRLAAASDYFMWASSHDHFASTMLERCVATLESRPDAVICCGQTALFERDVESAKYYDDVAGIDDDSPFQRFRAVVGGIRINNLVHGLIRTSALAKTPLVEDYYSSDNVLIAQLALAGKIVRLPEVLFYRRWEPRASTSRMTEREQQRHWDPDNIGMNRYTHWKINSGMLRAVLAADVPASERRRALWLTLKNAYWDKRHLASDLRRAMRAIGTGRATDSA